jgi:hypothetical protein
MTAGEWQIGVYDVPRAFESLEAFYRGDERRRTAVHGLPASSTDIFYDGSWPERSDERQRVIYSGLTGEIYAHPFDPGPVLDARLAPVAKYGSGYDSRALGPVYVFATVTWSLLKVLLEGELEAHMTTADNIGWLIGRPRAAARLERALGDAIA